jgi:hypothetical protein
MYRIVKILLHLLLIRAHVEEQELGRLVAGALDIDLARSAHFNVSAVTLSQHRVSECNLGTAILGLSPTAHNDLREDLPWTICDKVVADALARRQDGCVHGEICVEGNGTAARAIGGLHDATKLVGLLLIGELAGLVVWLQTALVWLRPDLEKVDLLFGVPVVLRVPDASASACELHLTTLEVLKVAHAVFVFQSASDDVAEDKELGVRMRPEACAWPDPIFVDDA